MPENMSFRCLETEAAWQQWDASCKDRGRTLRRFLEEGATVDALYPVLHTLRRLRAASKQLLRLKLVCGNKIFAWRV